MNSILDAANASTEWRLGMEYPFHRDCYDLIEESIKKNSVTFLLGPRKTGKTVCMRQLNEAYNNSTYYDFKKIPSDQHLDIFYEIYDAILNKEDRIFLLDEITYVDSADLKIYEIACKYTDVINNTTKIVFSGSQSVALSWWKSRAFAGNAGEVYIDFLTYSEFLRYKNIKEINPDTYNRFLYEASSFYKFSSLRAYLQECINETIVSNTKAYNYVYTNECDLIQNRVDLLIDICYQTMFTLHNSVSVSTFFKNDKVLDTISRMFQELYKDIGRDAIISKMEDSFIGSYRNIDSQSLNTLRQAFIFLKRCGLISITSITDNLDLVPDVYNSMLIERSDIDYKSDLFRKFNITINYPMFYISILQDILGKNMPAQLPKALLGSIVECHARGLLPNGFEYRRSIMNSDNREDTYEIDYINYSNLSAIEFTISNKHSTHFDILPDYMKCICLTKDKNYKKGNITYKDYCSFLYELSQSKEVTQKKVKPLFDVFK